MNRRLVLASLLGLASAAIVDPERLLWVPGRKLISIPKLIVIPAGFLRVGDVFTITARLVINPRRRMQTFRVTAYAESKDAGTWIAVPTTGPERRLA